VQTPFNEQSALVLHGSVLVSAAAAAIVAIIAMMTELPSG
jgi:hypothetical protein